MLSSQTWNATLKQHTSFVKFCKLLKYAIIPNLKRYFEAALKFFKNNPYFEICWKSFITRVKNYPIFFTSPPRHAERHLFK